jgi:mono/diheme cytochrome c family protein
VVLARKLLVFVAVLALLAGVLFVGGVLVNGAISAVTGRAAPGPDPTGVNANRLVVKGRNVFRFDTFGDQAVWGGVLGLHRAIEGAKHGGVGAGISPKQALGLGLKVDANAIPPNVATAIKAGKVDLDDPAVTLSLIKLNAVVGIKGYFDAKGNMASIGVTCAACHSTVDNSFAPGIGNRLDGWPNQDLNVGAIVAAAPNLAPLEQSLGVDEAALKKVLLGWGPGKFNAELDLDGKAVGPDGTPGSAATRIPSAFGKDGQNLHTWEGGWGSVSYWNAFVANLELHGIGTFFDPRLDDKQKFPLAAAAGFGHTKPYVGEGVLPVPSKRTGLKDQVTEALGALDLYQRALPVPKPPKGSYDPAAAARGAKVFDAVGCSDCHLGSMGTAPGYNAVRPAAVCTDAFQANRGPDGTYTIAPLQALFTRSKRGFYHDGRFDSLLAVVNHYDSCFKLGLSAQQKGDLVQYLKSR